MSAEFDVQEHLWITLSDGCRLGARLWLPRTAYEQRVPAIMEYIPYRKGDGTRARDEPMHGYFAQNGYAAIRVDMRGSGESDGHLADEYLRQEQDDALEVIDWIARQPWCSGAVGMMGKSWGGFNALQVAARRPAALRAIVTAYSTDDRFADDIHFMGGCLLNDNLWWGSIMLAYQGRPPDPAIAGDDWRAIWRARIDAMPFFPAVWAGHQSYDAYWRHGSVREDYSAIVCPVLIVGGWVDSYTNAVPRLLEGLTVPRQAIIGPWGHVYPQDGVPGPAIGFLQDVTRWWDRWLKDTGGDVTDMPAVRAFLQDPMPPDATRAEASGRWVSEGSWPSSMIEHRDWSLRGDGGLGQPDHSETLLRICTPQSHGRAGGEWMGTGCRGEMPLDQRLDDGFATVFQTGPLAQTCEVLGVPTLRVELCSDQPVATLVVRLSDVAPDGRAERVSYQVLNLTHRNGHATPAPMEPGRLVPVTVTLSACGHRFAAGHRIRVALGTTYWPMIWPAPQVATLMLRPAGSILTLPCRTTPPEQERAVVFDPPVHGPVTPVTQLEAGRLQRHFAFDAVSGVSTYVTDAVGGVFGEGVQKFDETDTVMAHSLRRELTIRDDDPLSARYVLTQSLRLSRPECDARIETRTEMTSDAHHFHLAGVLTVLDHGDVFARREWRESIPRTLL
ncbi:putative acyl esterase [Ameyamaea chiangmaiensis NBRC 103196]|nr:CocE/NonD family hydrolase [Ameyamaea chiangmaiensis]MBS4076064.1 CocE/NonD family hydrolase [Ameyamaea chiangmaiensis]GBQ66883.1 putative acyl esterase [Ameyamaea chiangmaiensis NBRC 103196]